MADLFDDEKVYDLIGSEQTVICEVVSSRESIKHEALKHAFSCLGCNLKKCTLLRKYFTHGSDCNKRKCFRCYKSKSLIKFHKKKCYNFNCKLNDCKPNI